MQTLEEGEQRSLEHSSGGEGEEKEEYRGIETSRLLLNGDYYNLCHTDQNPEDADHKDKPGSGLDDGVPQPKHAPSLEHNGKVEIVLIDEGRKETGVHEGNDCGNNREQRIMSPEAGRTEERRTIVEPEAIIDKMISDHLLESRDGKESRNQESSGPADMPRPSLPAAGNKPDAMADDLVGSVGLIEGIKPDAASEIANAGPVDGNQKDAVTGDRKDTVGLNARRKLDAMADDQIDNFRLDISNKADVVADDQISDVRLVDENKSNAVADVPLCNVGPVNGSKLDAVAVGRIGTVGLVLESKPDAVADDQIANTGSHGVYIRVHSKAYQQCGEIETTSVMCKILELADGDHSENGQPKKLEPPAVSLNEVGPATGKNKLCLEAVEQNNNDLAADSSQHWQIGDHSKQKSKSDFSVYSEKVEVIGPVVEESFADCNFGQLSTDVAVDEITKDIKSEEDGKAAEMNEERSGSKAVDVNRNGIEKKEALPQVTDHMTAVAAGRQALVIIHQRLVLQ